MMKSADRGPSRGRPIKPIENIRDVELIRSMLVDRPRDLLLFDFCTQTGLPVGDLLELKVGDVIELDIGDQIPAAMEKDSKSGPVLMNQRLHDTLERFFNRTAVSNDDYLFKSRKGQGPLDICTVSHLTGKWFREAGLTGLTGVKSLRKTHEMHFAEKPRADAGREKGALSGLNKVQAATYGEQVRTELVRAIMSGRIVPGERLFIRKIAREMNVSAMPVRDALARLEASGFVKPGKSRVYIVNALSKENLEEIAALRCMLEPMAAAESCRNITDEFLSRMKELNRIFAGEVAVGSANVDRIVRANQEFHFALYRHADKPILMEMISGLWDKVSPYLYLLTRESKSYDFAGVGLFNHREIVKGLENRDSRAVGHWVGADIEYSTRIALTDFYLFNDLAAQQV